MNKSFKNQTMNSLQMKLFRNQSDGFLYIFKTSKQKTETYLLLKPEVFQIRWAK